MVRRKQSRTANLARPLRHQHIISRCPKGGHTDMSDRHPALQSVMAGAVKNVRYANGGRRSRRFEAGKRCRVIHDGGCQQDFSAPPCLHVSGRSVIQSAGKSHAGKKQNIRPVPECVHMRGFGHSWRLNRRASRAGVRSRLRRTCLVSHTLRTGNRGPKQNNKTDANRSPHSGILNVVVKSRTKPHR
jgi:hypothetical protein